MSEGAQQFFVVLIWVKPGQIQTLHEYERNVVKLIERHGGSFEVVMNVESANLEDMFDRLPDEIHVLKFPSSKAFDAYRADPEGAAFANLRESSVERALFLQGAPVALFGSNGGG